MKLRNHRLKANLATLSKTRYFAIVTISALLIWQIARLSHEFSDISLRSVEVNSALAPYTYHPPIDFPSGVAIDNPEYLKGHKHGWYLVARTTHNYNQIDIPRQPPYYLPDRYYDSPDSPLSPYEQGIRDGYHDANHALNIVSNYSPRHIREDMEKAFSQYIIESTPNSVLEELIKMGYEFEH